MGEIYIEIGLVSDMNLEIVTLNRGWLKIPVARLRIEGILGDYCVVMAVVEFIRICMPIFTLGS